MTALKYARKSLSDSEFHNFSMPAARDAVDEQLVSFVPASLPPKRMAFWTPVISTTCCTIGESASPAGLVWPLVRPHLDCRRTA